LSWATHSHRSSRSQPCGQSTCKASRTTHGGIHDFLSHHKKSIRHVTLPVYLPGATDQLTNTHNGSTKQNSWDYRLNFFIRVQRRLDCAGHVWLQCICLLVFPNLTRFTTSFTAFQGVFCFTEKHRLEIGCVPCGTRMCPKLARRQKKSSIKYVCSIHVGACIYMYSVNERTDWFQTDMLT
jgi:hypothetical protein